MQVEAFSLEKAMRFEQFSIDVSGDKLFITQDGREDGPGRIELDIEQVPHFIDQLRKVISLPARG